MLIRKEDDGWQMDLSDEEKAKLLDYAKHATWDILLACGTEDDTGRQIAASDLDFDPCVRILNKLRFGGDGNDVIRQVASYE
jgi:hypothetical protein